MLLRDTLRSVLDSGDGRPSGTRLPGDLRGPTPNSGFTAPPRVTAESEATVSAEQAGHVQLILHHGHVTLILRTSPLPCVVTAPVDPLRAFLQETDRMVPPGAEGCPAALEAEIARMLADN